STKCSVKLATGLQVDLRVVPAESFGAALLYYTGSKAHNMVLRQLAIKRKLKLNEYGLLRGTRRVAGRTEEEIYDHLGLAYIPPELREDQGVIESAWPSTRTSTSRAPTRPVASAGRSAIPTPTSSSTRPAA